VSERPLRRLPSDRYSDFSLVGKGGMGVVYLALDSELNRRVAFKMVLPDPKADRNDPAPRTPQDAIPPDQSDPDSSRSFEEWRNRFLQEAWVTGAMEHPGIVPVYELGETEEGIPYYTMRYVTGERTLKVAIEEADSFDDRLALLEPFLKICDTIRYAHARGVVHRDLKPENIALGSFGEVIVLDWGLAKAEGQPDNADGDWQAKIDAYRDATDFKTVAGALGTPGFMAPEAALGRSAEVDVRSDVYSLGAILHLILTGKLPFQFTNFLEYVNLIIKEDAPRADEVDDAVPSELADACAQALRREPDDRYAGVGELAAAVRRWQIEGPIEREIRVLLERAHQEFEAGKDRTGTLLLLHLDRATAAVNRVLHLRPDHEDAHELQLRLKTLREHGIHARVKTERLVVLQRVAAALLAVGAVVALIVFGLLSDEREKAANQLQASRDRLIDAELKATQERNRTQRTRAALARSLATLSQSARENGRGDVARILAATALVRSQDEHTWKALAAAERMWTPTLRWIVHDVIATTLAFDDENPMLLAIGDEDGAVHAIDLSTEPPRVTTHELFDGAVRHVGYMAIEYKRCIVAGSDHGQVALIVPGADGGVRRIPAGLPPRPKSVEFEDDTLYRGTAVTTVAAGPDDGLLVGYADGRIRQFDDEDNLLHVARHHAGAVNAIAHQTVTGAYVSGGEDGGVCWWKTPALLLTEMWDPSESGAIAGVHLDSDLDLLETWSADGAISAWDLESGGVVREPRARGVAPAAKAVLTGDGQRMVVTDAGARISVFDRATGKLLYASGRHGDRILCCAANRKGPLLAVAGDDGGVRIWDQWMRSDTTPLVAVADPERRRIVEAVPGGMVRIRSDESETPTLLEDASLAHITAMALSPEGDRIALADLSGQLHVWNLETERRVASLKGNGESLTAIAWAEGDGRLLSGNLEGDVRVWVWPTRKWVTFDKATRNPIALLTRARETNRVAAADVTGRIALWDSHAKTVLRKWKGSGPLSALALSPNARLMAAVRVDGMLIVWDGTKWTERGLLPDIAPILSFEIDSAGRARWVTAHGGIGVDTTMQDAPALQALRDGGPWILVSPTERSRQLDDAFGLKLDPNDFRTHPIPIARFHGAIRIER